MLQSKDKEWLNGYKNKSYSYAAYERLTIDLDLTALPLAHSTWIVIVPADTYLSFWLSASQRHQPRLGHQSNFQILLENSMDSC